MAKLRNISSNDFINNNFIREVEPKHINNGKRIYNIRQVELRCLECGKHFIASLGNALKLQQKYCGRACSVKQKMLTNLHTKKDYLYMLWGNMKARCYNSKNTMYHCYGALGINVSDEFRSDFLKFREYVLTLDNAPTKFDVPLGVEIDRINVNGDYERGNLRWVTLNQNRANRRPRNNTGHRNITKIPNGNFLVTLTRDKIIHHIGTFKTLEEAIYQRDKYVKEHNLFW